jgi:hypothetical protein
MEHPWCASPGLAALTALYLAVGWVGDAGVEALARSEHSRWLVKLTLAQNRNSDESALVPPAVIRGRF